jgi:hypothetical protein
VGERHRDSKIVDILLVTINITISSSQRSTHTPSYGSCPSSPAAQTRKISDNAIAGFGPSPNNETASSQRTLKTKASKRQKENEAVDRHGPSAHTMLKIVIQSTNTTLNPPQILSRSFHRFPHPLLDNKTQPTTQRSTAAPNSLTILFTSNTTSPTPYRLSDRVAEMAVDFPNASQGSSSCNFTWATCKHEQPCLQCQTSTASI